MWLTRKGAIDATDLSRSIVDSSYAVSPKAYRSPGLSAAARARKMPRITACRCTNAGARDPEKPRNYLVLLNFVIASSRRCNAEP